MKKNLLQLFLLALSANFYCQVGINTSNPQATLHIDGQKDNPLTGTTLSSTQVSNDVVITSNGNIGIGTANPTRKLEIISSTTPALRIQDGNQKVNYAMMSDANGYGTWKALSDAILAKFPTTGYSGPVTQGNANGATNVSITLPPGRWLVLTNIVLATTPVTSGGAGAWVRLVWSDSPTTNNPVPFVGGYNSGNIVSPYGNAIGTTLVVNNSNAEKTYYLFLGGVDVFGGYTGNWNNIGSSQYPENSIVAYPAN